MKTLAYLSVPKQVDSDFPYGAIINETDVNEGTPVIRELYNDILVNNYKLLELAGITPNGNEDSETNGYQIIEALKKLHNLLNDIEQVLSLSGTVFSLPLKFSLLPNKYILIARAGDNYNLAGSYTIKGSEESPAYSFTCSTGFRNGDELLIVLDNSGARAYNLTAILETRIDIVTPFGTPIAYNSTKQIHYFDGGTLMTDQPRAWYIQQTIRSEQLDTSILVLNAFILKGKLLCFCFSATNGNYFFYQFDMLSLTVGEMVDYTISDADDFKPYCYTDGTYVYLTNDANTSANNYSLRKLNYNEVTATITNNTTYTLESSFVKTTNVVMKSNALISLVNGVLSSFALGASTRTELGIFNANSGNIFVHNSTYFHGVGQVAIKWNL